MTDRNYSSFKNQIQSIFNPWQWNPSDLELQALAKAFEFEKPSTYRQALAIFSRHFPNQLLYAAEGEDNSDYRTLLSMAIESAKGTAK